MGSLLLLASLAPFRNAYLLRGLVVWMAVRMALAFGGVPEVAGPVGVVVAGVAGLAVWLDARRRAEDLFLGNLGIPGWTIAGMATPLVLLAETLVP